MSKNEFLKVLNKQLRKLKASERRRHISYYDELISDMTENGISEETAVEKIGSPKDISDAIFKDSVPEDFKKTDKLGRCLIMVSFILLILTLFFCQASHIPYSYSAIGGADGPTSIFIAGKLSRFSALYILTAVVICITVVYKIFRHVKRR